MMADIKVLMMGGRRTGKSSVLASMVKQLYENGSIQTFVNIAPERVLSDVEAEKSLPQKQNDLQTFLYKPKDNLYIVDFNADEHFTHYLFKVKIPNCRGSIGVDFVDCPGESFGNNAREDLFNNIRDNIPDTNVFIIVIDTPYLMDDDSDPGMFKKINACIEITGLFQMYSQFNRDDDYKKIIFVPVKCEAWKDKLDEVSRKLLSQDYYGPLFDLIRNDSRWSCSIIPALTAGGIEFSGFSEPLLLDGVECRRLGTEQVRMGDGSTRELAPDDKIIENKEYKIHFPYYSWFKNTGIYHPENCDQVAFHVVRFIVFKIFVDRTYGLLPGLIWGLPRQWVLRELFFNLDNSGLINEGNPNSNSADKGIINIRKIETREKISQYKISIFS